MGPPQVASKARGVEIVYWATGLAPLHRDQRGAAPGEKEARGRERGEGQQSDCEATNTHLQARGTKGQHRDQYTCQRKSGLRGFPDSIPS